MIKIFNREQYNWVKKGEKKILFTSKDYSESKFYPQTAIHISKIIPRFSHYNRFKKTIILIIIQNNFKTVVFNYDYKILTLYYLLSLSFLWPRNFKNIIFITLLIDINRLLNPWQSGNVSQSIKNMIIKYIIIIPNHIIVHTKKEKYELEKLVRYGRSQKIHFIKFPALDVNINKYKSDFNKGIKYILCAGNYRDINTFTKAIEKTTVHGVIISGCPISSINKSAKIEYFVNVDLQFYRSAIKNATAVVLPFKKSSPLRSLGQITACDCISMGVPLIVAKSFHLIDYFNDNDVIYYEPENSIDLQKKINYVLKTGASINERNIRLKNNIMDSLSLDNFVKTLVNISC